MEPTQILNLTQKGLDEIKTRANKLSMKKRSVLILLERPQTVQYVIGRGVLGRSEVIEEITALITEGFLTTDSALAAAPVPSSKLEDPVAPAPRVTGGLVFSDEIILSEAKYLMSNFCVDVFGTGSQQFVDNVGQCKSADQFSACAQQIYDATKAKHPAHLKTLDSLLKEIHDTAL